MKTLKDLLAQSILGIFYLIGYAIGAAATMITEGIADGTRAVDEFNERVLEEAVAKGQGREP